MSPFWNTSKMGTDITIGAWFFCEERVRMAAPTEPTMEELQAEIEKLTSENENLKAELKQMKNNQTEKLKNEGKLIDYRYTKDGKTYHVEGSITEKKETNTSSMSEEEKKELATKEAEKKKANNAARKSNQFMFEVEIQHKTYIVNVTVTELKKNSKANGKANGKANKNKTSGGRRKRSLRITRKKQ